MGAVEGHAILANSPLLLAPIIEEFFVELPEKRHSFLLAYVVLPIITYSVSKEFVINSTIRSSVRTLCTDRERIIGIHSRINKWRSTTNVALENSLACGQLKLLDSLAVVPGDLRRRSSSIYKREQLAAKKLARLFGPYDVVTICRFLGVEEL